MPLCNICTKQRHFGAIKFSVGLVSHLTSSISHPNTFSDDPNDAFWLAQTYFMTHQYSRAERLLTRPFPTSTSKRVSVPPEPINGHVPDVFSSKGKSREQDPPQPTPVSIPRFPVGSGGMIEVPQEMQERVSRLVDMSVACRYLAAQCQVIHPCLYPGRRPLTTPAGQTRQLGRSD